MKQRLFCICLVLMVATVSAVAEDYGFKVGGVSVTSSNRINVTGGSITPKWSSVNNGKASVVYNPSTKTLTLWNVFISATSGNAILNESCDGLIIVLKGDNSLEATKDRAIMLKKNTTIKSLKDENGYVQSAITGGTGGGEGRDAIYVKGNSTVSTTTLTIQDANLMIDADASCFDADKSKYSGLVIKNSTITATCRKNKSGDCYALFNYYNLSVSNSTVTLTGYNQAVAGLNNITLGDGQKDILTPGAGIGYGTLSKPAGEVIFHACTSFTGGSQLIDSPKTVKLVMSPKISDKFPDANFRAAVAASDIDKGQDGYLDWSERLSPTALNVQNKGIKDMTGIELFEKITELRIYGNKIEGAKMNALITSLPKVSSGVMIAYSGASSDNVMTPAQVNRAKEKGWTVREKVGSGLQNYSGMAGVEINATNFPDARFRSFVTSSTIDTFQDGYLTEKELEAQYFLNVSGKSISDLTGIAYFTEIIFLDCSNNSLTTLNLSQNKKLSEVACCGNNICGNGMDKLVNNLPSANGDGTIYILEEGAATDNHITKAQVEIAKIKGWTVMKILGENQAVEYGGDDITIKGDFNSDNDITQADLDALVKAVMGEVPAGVNKLVFDLNNDGKVDAADIVTMVKILNGN